MPMSREEAEALADSWPRQKSTFVPPSPQDFESWQTAGPLNYAPWLKTAPEDSMNREFKPLPLRRMKPSAPPSGDSAAKVFSNLVDGLRALGARAPTSPAITPPPPQVGGGYEPSPEYSRPAARSETIRRGLETGGSVGTQMLKLWTAPAESTTEGHRDLNVRYDALPVERRWLRTAPGEGYTRQEAQTLSGARNRAIGAQVAHDENLLGGGFFGPEVLDLGKAGEYETANLAFDRARGQAAAARRDRYEPAPIETMPVARKIALAERIQRENPILSKGQVIDLVNRLAGGAPLPRVADYVSGAEAPAADIPAADTDTGPRLAAKPAYQEVWVEGDPHWKNLRRIRSENMRRVAPGEAGWSVEETENQIRSLENKPQDAPPATYLPMRAAPIIPASIPPGGTYTPEPEAVSTQIVPTLAPRIPAAPATQDQFESYMNRPEGPTDEELIKQAFPQYVRQVGGGDEMLVRPQVVADLVRGAYKVAPDNLPKPTASELLEYVKQVRPPEPPMPPLPPYAPRFGPPPAVRGGNLPGGLELQSIPWPALGR